jgi:glycosyltransferase involved in cell wall biosynthesis
VGFIKTKVTVILNVYKRSSYFELQLNAIKQQSVQPLEILVWENGEDTVPKHLIDGITVARSTKNFGVWARFAYALNSESDYVCIFDDDTIPGFKWIENCLSTMQVTPGLLGTRGIIFENGMSYSLYRDVGVHSPNENTQEVDIVGHAWFFKRIWLENFWSEYSNRFSDSLAGEDIHFSYVLQKHLGLPTLVPKHPKNQPEFWGSLPNFANVLGQDQNSISVNPKSLVKFEKALQHYRKLGFITQNEREKTNSRFPIVVYWLIQKFPSSLDKINKIKNIFKLF